MDTKPIIQKSEVVIIGTHQIDNIHPDNYIPLIAPIAEVVVPSAPSSPL